MAQNNKTQHEEKGHHFLFYIFKRDKLDNPMPPKRAQALLQYLKSVLNDSVNDKGRK